VGNKFKCDSKRDAQSKSENDNNYSSNFTNNNDTEPSPVIPIPLPEPLKSDGKEPIIESVWKMFVATYSYCYKHFDQFYNDHHKYITVMFPLFSNQIQRD
jgi:hypothetical protein